MTKYIFNNEEYTSEQVQDAANQSGVDIDTYIKEAGLETVSEEDFEVKDQDTFEVQDQPVEKPKAVVEETAPAAADTDLQLENGSSELQEKQLKKQAFQSAAKAMNPAAYFFVDKLANAGVAALDFIKGVGEDAGDAITEAVYIANNGNFKNEKERESFNLALDSAKRSGVFGPAGRASTVLGDIAEKGIETLDIAVEERGQEDFITLAEKGDYAESADAFLSDLSGAGVSFLLSKVAGVPGAAAQGISTGAKKFSSLGEEDPSLSLLNRVGTAVGTGAADFASEIVTAGTGKILNKIGKKVGLDAVKGVGGKILKTFGGTQLEGLSEGGAEYFETVLDKYVAGDEKAFDGFGKRFFKNYLIGSVLGGGSVALNQLNSGAKDIVNVEIQPKSITDSQRKVRQEIQELNAELEYEIDPIKKEGLRKLIVDKEQALKASKENVQENVDGLSDEQLKRIADLNVDIQLYEEMLEESPNQDLIRNEINKRVQEKQDIFANPEIIDTTRLEPISQKAKDLSKKTQDIYDEKGVEGYSEIADAQIGNVKRIATYKWSMVSPDKRVGTYEDFVSGLINEKSGLRDLIKSYKPETNVPLAAYISTELPKRANRIIKKYTKQDFQKDVSAPEIQALTVDMDTNFDVSLGPRTVAEKLKIGKDVIENAYKNVEKGALVAEKAIDKASGKTIKRQIAEKNKAINKFFLGQLKKEIQSKVGKNTKTKDDFSKFLKQNVNELRNIALKQIDFQKGSSLVSKSWNITPPLDQDFIDYYEGKDTDNTQAISDRKARLIEAISNGIARDAIDEFKQENPDFADAFVGRTGIEYKAADVKEETNTILESLTSVSHVQEGDYSKAGQKPTQVPEIKKELPGMKAMYTVKKSFKREIEAGLPIGAKVYPREVYDRHKDQGLLGFVETSFALGYTTDIGLMHNRYFNPGISTGQGSPMYIAETNGTYTEIQKGDKGIAREDLDNIKANKKTPEQLLEENLISEKTYKKYKNNEKLLQKVELQTYKAPKKSTLGAIINIVQSNEYKSVKERIDAIKKVFDPEVYKANALMFEILGESLKHQYDNGKITRPVLASMFVGQTSIQKGFRSLTQLNSIQLADGPVDITKGEHTNINAATMIHLYKYIIGDPDAMGIKDIAINHTQDFGNKIMAFDPMDKALGTTTPVKGNIRASKVLDPDLAGQFYSPELDDFILNIEIKNILKDSDLTVTEAYELLKEEYKD